MHAARPTLRDVALAAGVSHMTVSRVVRGDRRVREKTRLKVEAAIAQVDYRPDPVLSALAAYRAGQSSRSGAEHLAFLDFEGNDYNVSIKTGIAEQGAIFGYLVSSFKLKPSPAELSRCARLIYNRGIRGVLIGPTYQPITLSGFHWDQVAAVSLGAIPQDPPLHSVGMDYFQGMTLAVEELAKLGYRRFGLVIEGRFEARSAHRWLGAFLAGSFLAGSIAVPPLLTDERLSLTTLERWHRAYLPDVLLTIDSTLPKLARRLSPAPEVVYLNDVSCAPGHAHLELDPREIGREAVRVLHPLLLKLEYGIPSLAKSVVLPCRWKHRT